MPVKHPFKVKPRNPLWDFITPINTGLLVGVTLAAFPRAISVGGKYTEYITDILLKSNVIPRQLCVAGLGFVAAYITAKTLNWIRWKLVKSLLTYTGWVTSPKSLRTKVQYMMLVSFSVSFRLKMYVNLYMTKILNCQIL